MKEIAEDIARSVIYRKKARFINRLIMINELGEDNLAFIADAVKEVEWDTVRKEPEEDCDCFGCGISGNCEKLEYRYKLNLETMDLARSIPESSRLFENIDFDEDGRLFEYIDFDEDAGEVDGALMAIWTALDCFRQ